VSWGVAALVSSVICAKKVLERYYKPRIETPTKNTIEQYAPQLAKSSRPEPLTKYATLDESQQNICVEKERIKSENPGIADEWESIRGKAYGAGNAYAV